MHGGRNNIMAMIKVEENCCKGCGICIVNCPRSCLTLSEGFNEFGNCYCVQTEPDKCIGCKLCGIMCPDSAISVFK